MNRDIVVNYLNSGMMDLKNCKKFILSSGLLTICGIAPGIIFGSYWFYIGLGMLFVFAISTCTVFYLITKEVTLKIKLKIQTLIFACWYIQISGLNAIVYTYEYGINYQLVFLYLPSLLFCLFLFILTDIMIKTGKFSKKRSSSIKGLGLGLAFSLIGWRLASILDNSLANEVTVPIINFCFTIIDVFLSFGFLNFQKLFYLHKIESGKTEDGSMS